VGFEHKLDSFVRNTKNHQTKQSKISSLEIEKVLYLLSLVIFIGLVRPSLPL
jgi:cell division protein FtsL